MQSPCQGRKDRGNHCRVSNILFKVLSKFVGKSQDGHFELNVQKRRASQAQTDQTVTDAQPLPLLPSKNSAGLNQSQERPLAKVWRTPVHPVATPLTTINCYVRRPHACMVFSSLIRELSAGWPVADDTQCAVCQPPAGGDSRKVDR